MSSVLHDPEFNAETGPKTFTDFYNLDINGSLFVGPTTERQQK